MSNPRECAALLTSDDLTFLAVKYSAEKDFLASLDDNNWCDFLNCQMTELPYLLFEDDDLIDDIWEGIFDEHSEIDDDEMFEDEVIDVDAFLEEQAKLRPVQQSIFALPRPQFKPHNYKKPSPLAKKQIVVTHHFEIVR